MSWRIVSLGEIATSIDYGFTAAATQEAAGPKFLRITDIQSGSVNWETVPYCNHIDGLSVQKRLTNGDIVFARTGSVGKTYLVRDCPNDAVFASYLIRVRVLSLVDPRYLIQYFQTPSYWSQVKAAASGGVQLGINSTELKRLKVPLPSLDEQRRIAAILEQAEDLRRKRRLAIEKLNALPQAIFREMFGDPVHNTKNLPLVSLSQLGSWHSGGTPSRKRDDYFGGTIPWFSSGELNKVTVYESKERISEIALIETSSKRVPKGALMLGMYDSAALKASIAGVDCSCNQAIAFATINSSLAETAYVYHAICLGRDEFRRQQRGIRQKNLNLQMIREIALPLPPISEQHRFTSELLDIYVVVNRAETHLEMLNQLFASLQHHAFSGTLSQSTAAVALASLPDTSRSAPPLAV